MAIFQMESKRLFHACSCLLTMFSLQAVAQENKSMLQGDDYRVETTLTSGPSNVSDAAVATNTFKHNWFIFANGGVQKFVGEYNDYGSFGKTLAPEGHIGLGHWFIPSFGAGLETGLGRSRGFTAVDHITKYTCDDELFTNSDGIEYYRQSINWWNLGANAYLNLSRMISGYEGSNQDKLMGQFILNLGIGWMHHAKLRNEICGTAGIQYSRFINPKKRTSIDVKLPFTFYQSNYDGLYGYDGCRKINYNVSLVLGVTFHSKRNSWEKADEVAAQTTIYKVKGDSIMHQEAPVVPASKPMSFTFYVVYPKDSVMSLNDVVASGNDHSSLGEIKSSGYKSGNDEALYSFADVYAAVLRLKGDNRAVRGADDNSVTGLVNILSSDVLTRINILSCSSKIDYYANNINQQKENAQSMQLADQRAREVLNLLKSATRQNSVSSNVMLINEMDIKRDQCVKVTVSYLTK